MSNEALPFISKDATIYMLKVRGINIAYFSFSTRNIFFKICILREMCQRLYCVRVSGVLKESQPSDAHLFRILRDMIADRADRATTRRGLVRSDGYASLVFGTFEFTL